MKRRNLAKLITLLIMIVGTITIIKVANKVTWTSFELIGYNFDTQYYNEEYRKTDSMTENYANHVMVKRNAIYNSDEAIVKWFANLPGIIKVLGTIIAVAMYPLFIWYWLGAISIIVKRERKRKIHRRRSY